MFTSLLRCYCILFFVAFLGAYKAGAQDTRQEFMIRGKVFDMADSIPLQLINIIDQHTHMGVPSGLDGSFSVAVFDGDSLRFSSIGYKDFYLIVKASTTREGLKIYLSTANYELMPITVTPYGERVFLRQSFKDLSRRERGDTVHISLKSGATGPSPPSSVGFSIGWDPLGNSIRRQNAVIAKWIRKQEMDSLAALKFNPQFVKELTGIPDSEVDDFMAFCDLKTNYILSATDYDLGETIKKYYRSYRSQSHRASQYEDIREY